MRQSYEGAYLSVEEAAERLGVSTLRVRKFFAEGLIDALKDNSGRWRFMVPGTGLRHADSASPIPVDPVDLLLDEIMDLRHEVVTRVADIDRLKALVVRQNQLLEKLILEKVALRQTAASAVEADLPRLLEASLNLTERAITMAADRARQMRHLQAEIDLGRPADAAAPEQQT